MTEQLRITDIVPDIIPPPEMWSCMKTCRHMGEEMSHFPGTNMPRCDYGFNCDKLHGGQVSKVIDNVWHTWCRYYEEARP